MAKLKIKIDKNEEPVIPTPVVDIPVEEVKEPVKDIYPEGKKNGKFHSVKVDGGYVVYNPDGSRVSGIVTLIQANDIVREQNQAAHIKG